MFDTTEGLGGKRVLVTGAGGFIGSALVHTLIARGVQVIAEVNEGASMGRLKPLLGHSSLIVRTRPAGDNWLKSGSYDNGDVDLVAHLELSVPKVNSFHQRSLADIESNLVPTLRLLGSLSDTLLGICFASSMDVYGENQHLPVRETDMPAPVSPYAAMKLATEIYLATFGRSRQIPVTILRYGTVYGPGETAHRAIPRFIDALARGERPLIYGDGLDVRDYVYVDDVVNATAMALRHRPDGVLNIGTGSCHSTLEVVQQIITLSGLDIEPRFCDDSRKHISCFYDISAATTILGYRPQVEFRDGLAREIAWHRKQA